MDFDDILEDLGDFGKYQKIIIFIVLLPAVIPCGFHAYNQIFMSAKPDHWCRVPQLESRNISMDLIKNLSVPLGIVNGIEKYKECFYYNKTYIEDFGWKEAEEIPCQDGWVFDKTKYTSTVVTEWDLVCDRDFYTTFALVLFGVGGCIGNYIFGYIQDSMGRKTAFFIYLLIENVFGIASAFANSFTLWTILRFGIGFTIPAILGSPYVLAVELVGPKKRAYITILLNIAYSMSLVLLSGICYIVRDWRKLTLATTLPFLILFFYWWVMPESPRWLYARGKLDKCSKILETIAEINNIDLNKEYVAEMKKIFLEEQKSLSLKPAKNYGVYDLFRYPNLRKKTILITLIWFTNTAVYVGLSYYAPALGTDEFLNFFLAGIVELPTYIFLWPAMEKLGRRWTLCSSMVIGGLACLATIFTENREIITLVLYCIGKMGISCSFVVLPLMASELYPTVVRGIGMSFSSVIGQVGPIVIPIINYLGEDWMVLPLVIMGSLLVFGGGLSLILPETLHQHLPETLQEAETFGKNSLKCCTNRNSIRQEVTNTKNSKYSVNLLGLNNRKHISEKVDTKEVQSEF